MHRNCSIHQPLSLPEPNRTQPEDTGEVASKGEGLTGCGIVDRYGFTLLELIVSIAVMAVLALLLMTVISRSVDSAQSIKCIGNLRQLAAGWISFCSDHNGKSVVIAYDSPTDNKYVNWQAQISPYIGSDIDRLVLCPSASEYIPMGGDKMGTSKLPWTARNSWGASSKSSYGFFQIWYSDLAAPGYDSWRIDRVQKANQAYPLIADSTWIDDGPWMNYPADYRIGHGWALVRHRDKGINIAFSDGTVRFVSMGEWYRDIKWSPVDTPPHLDAYNNLPEKYR